MNLKIDAYKVKFITFLLFFCLCSFIDASKNELPHPYNEIELLPFDPEGHFGKNQSDGLAFLIKKYDPQVVVEIGSYLGASTRFIASHIVEKGIVYAIDHWLGNAEWHNKPNFQEQQKQFYQQFLSNVIHANLCHKIIPMRMSSLEAARVFGDTPDLVFLDGSHDYKSVYEDICAWYKHVEGYGVLCGDDYHWGHGYPVKRAVDQFARERNLKVHLINNWFWYYEK